MEKTTKLQPNGGHITTTSLGEGYLAINKKLLDSLLKENTPHDYLVCYIVLLAMARHQEDTADTGVCHGEVLVSAADLSKIVHMDDNRLRSCIYWLESKQLIKKRLINGRRVILLTQYDAYTTIPARKARKAKPAEAKESPVSKFNDEIAWD